MYQSNFVESREIRAERSGSGNVESSVGGGISKSSFAFRLEWAEDILKMSPETGSKLVIALLDYVVNGTVPEELVLNGSMFMQMRRQIDRDEAMEACVTVTHNTHNTHNTQTDSSAPVSPGSVLSSLDFKPSGSDDAQQLFDFCRQCIVETGASLAVPVRLVPERLGMIQRCLEEFTVEEMQAAIQKACRSSFLNGGGAKGFVASFEWLFLPQNILKILEGKYDDKSYPKMTTVGRAATGEKRQTAAERHRKKEQRERKEHDARVEQQRERYRRLIPGAYTDEQMMEYTQYLHLGLDRMSDEEVADIVQRLRDGRIPKLPSSMDLIMYRANNGHEMSIPGLPEFG